MFALWSGKEFEIFQIPSRYSGMIWRSGKEFEKFEITSRYNIFHIVPLNPLVPRMAIWD